VEDRDIDRSGDLAFSGSVAELYERLLVPMIFTEPARMLAAAAAEIDPRTILETAAGTGVLTRALVEATHAEITATDLNPPMLRKAESLCGSSRVHWQVADAMDLPFPDGQYDVVVCQFGAMFFPDKVGGYAEAARVLRPGGSFLFSVWDRIEANAVADIVTRSLVAAAPGASLEFLRRTPHGYFDVEAIERDLRRAGFEHVRIEPGDGTSRTTAHEGAVACCQGSPLRGEIEQAPELDLERATAIAEEALEKTFGAGTFDAPTRWFQVIAQGPRGS
jgi:ubiquinone/menaquinone biosynthesis C-methylase UbiE